MKPGNYTNINGRTLLCHIIRTLHDHDTPLCAHSIAMALDQSILRTLSSNTPSTIVKNEINSYLRTIDPYISEIERIDGLQESRSSRKTFYRYRRECPEANQTVKHKPLSKNTTKDVPASKSTLIKQNHTSKVIATNKKQPPSKPKDTKLPKSPSHPFKTIVTSKTPYFHPLYSLSTEKMTCRQSQGPFGYDLSFIGGRRNSSDLEAEILGSFSAVPVDDWRLVSCSEMTKNPQNGNMQILNPNIDPSTATSNCPSADSDTSTRQFGSDESTIEDLDLKNTVLNRSLNDDVPDIAAYWEIDFGSDFTSATSNSTRNRRTSGVDNSQENQGFSSNLNILNSNCLSIKNPTPQILSEKLKA